MKKLAPLVLLLLFLPLTAKAGVNRWTPFGRGDDTVLDLLLEPAGLYSVTSDGRVFLSTDGGEAWQYWGVGLGSGIRQIAADPADPRAMTAVSTQGDVYRSVDAGRFWSRLPHRVDEELDPVVASLETAAGTIYVGGRYLYFSRDNGETWINTTPVQGYIPSITVDPTDPRTVWFATSEGLWKTADAGETFTLALNPPYEIGSAGVTAVGVAPSRPAAVYAGANRRSYSSQDGGATWQPGGDAGVGDLIALAVDPANPAKVYATGPGGIALSQDGGATWTVLAERLAASSLILGPGTLFAGTYGDGLYASQDAGRSWSRRDRVGMGYPVTTFVKRHPRSRSVLYLFHATIGPGLLRSLDDGRTWAPFSDVNAARTYLVDLAIANLQPAVLYAVSFANGAFRIEPDGTAKRMPVPTQREMHTVITAGRYVLVGNSWAGYRSGDGGETWRTVLPHTVRTEPGGDVTRTVLRLTGDPRDPSILYAYTFESGPGGSEYVALRSYDYGFHWRRIRTGDLDVLAVDPANRGTLYVAEKEGDQTILLKSRDYGGLWHRVGTIPGPPQGRVSSLVVDRKHPDVLWASNDLGVLRSEDGGRTWEPFNAGLARAGLVGPVELVRDPAVRGKLYAMPAGGGLFELTTN
jgi:photosystem II stability/assembly factor-like uncharacterized protein